MGHARGDMPGPLQVPTACGARSRVLRSGEAPSSLESVPEFSSKDPLHGVTLERLLVELVDRMGWRELGRQVPVRCFLFDPSIKSSLVFLRRTPWARAKVEQIYVSLGPRPGA